MKWTMNLDSLVEEIDPQVSSGRYSRSTSRGMYSAGKRYARQSLDPSPAAGFLNGAIHTARASLCERHDEHLAQLREQLAEAQERAERELPEPASEPTERSPLQLAKNRRARLVAERADAQKIEAMARIETLRIRLENAASIHTDQLAEVVAAGEMLWSRFCMGWERRKNWPWRKDDRVPPQQTLGEPNPCPHEIANQEGAAV